MSDDQQVERITILGEEIPVRIADTDGVAREAVNLVEEKVQSIQEGSNSPSNLQVALLSSLNIAGEYIKQKRETQEQQLSESTADRLRSLSDRIENLLADE